MFKNTFYAHFEGFWSPSYVIYVYAHIDLRIALAKEMIGTFSMRQSTPLLKPLYVGPTSPNEQFMSHQNHKIDPPTL